MDRPDLITPVFKFKLQSLADHIQRTGLLGQLAAHMYVIQFQKRGLAHDLIAVIFANQTKALSPMDYNHVICADIPDSNADRDLYDSIAKCYIPGPCGDKNSSFPYMKNGRCSTVNPKELVDAKIDNEDGYTVYQWGNNGRTLLSRGPF